MLTHDSDSSASETALRRGIAAARAGLRSVAAAQFERAAESLPDDSNVWLWLAWVANSPDNTIRCLERVLELSPGHAAATAGLTWARGLSQDTPQEVVAIPMSVTVAESLPPIVPVAEPASFPECFATNDESAQKADIANETLAEPTSDVVTDPQLNTSEEINPIPESVELSEESAPETIAQHCAEIPCKLESDESVTRIDLQHTCFDLVIKTHHPQIALQFRAQHQHRA